jgi:hypothetical protein
MDGDEFAKRAWERQDRTYQQLLNASMDSAKDALRALLAVNGGGCLALLTFLGTAVRIEDPVQQELLSGLAIGALRWFGFGVLAVVLATGLAHLANNFCATAIAKRRQVPEHPYSGDTPASRAFQRAATTLNALTVASAIVSIACFLVGILRIGPMF